MLKRQIRKKIDELRSKYPVIQVTGPRQSGKTTLVKQIFKDYKYKNLENPDERLIAQKDPRSFLKLGSGQKMIIDEVQMVPELVSFIQVEVDEQKINGQFVITGSQNFKISETVSQSLAGRVAIFELLPLSYEELGKYKDKLEIAELLWKGFFPAVYSRNISPVDFYRDLTNTYITRDVRSIKNIGNLSNFQRFLGLLAGRVGQLLNKVSLADDVGISVKTVEEWLSILEASYLVVRLQPFFENVSKRLVKSPKVYFSDTGLVAYLLGINSVEELKKHFIYGSLFENFIIMEKLKYVYNHRKNEGLYFWRDSKGVEIDLLVDRGLNKSLVEIKLGQTFNSDFLKNIKKVSPLLEGKYRLAKYLVYGGEGYGQTSGVMVQNWRQFVKI
ncbi:AAA family ATPase [Candidatus Shapirobacteria bacterium]|nr:MAG: AAA family ATPase [Candidatus Shapirobacteria bacterium]